MHYAREAGDPGELLTVRKAVRALHISRELALLKEDVMNNFSGDMVVIPTSSIAPHTYGVVSSATHLDATAAATDLSTVSRPLAALDRLRGVLFVRKRESPWFRGVFSFTIHLPESYPSEPPMVVFDERLGVPGLREECTVIFDAVTKQLRDAAAVPPAPNGIRRLQFLVPFMDHVRRLFWVDLSNLPPESMEAWKGRGRFDVERRSVLRASMGGVGQQFAELCEHDGWNTLTKALQEYERGTNQQGSRGISAEGASADEDSLPDYERVTKYGTKAARWLPPTALEWVRIVRDRFGALS
jgi:hypothetical protein